MVAFTGFLITCNSIFEIIIIELRGKAIHWHLKAIVPISKTSFSPLLKSIIISGANIIPKILTTSKKKNELNTIRVHLTQKDDTDLNLINIPIELKVVEGTTSKIVNVLNTDNNGYAEFVLEDPSTIKDGTYYYQLISNPLPAGYYEPENVATIRISVLYG